MVTNSYSGNDINEAGDFNEGDNSRGFLPSGPSDLPSGTSDLAPVTNDKVHQSNRHFKRLGRFFLTGPFISICDLNSSLMFRSASATRYFNIVEKIAPNDMIQKFAATAPANVQAACKSTVVNILGSLPTYALDAALITSSTKLSNLLHQMQITGYMFKNAEYQMSFIRSLKGTSITGS